MLKKVLCVVLCIVMLISVAGCGQKAAGENETITSPTVGSTTPPSTEPATEATNNQSIETDEKLLTVDITLPADFFTEEDMSTFDFDAYASEQGFISAKPNDDGSVVVTMTKAKHKEVLAETAATIDANFAEIVADEDTPYIKEITHNDDFTAVTVKVDRAAYENAFDLTPLQISMNVILYQMLLDMDYYTEISIVDISTDEVFNTVIYPDAFESQ